MFPQPSSSDVIWIDYLLYASLFLVCARLCLTKRLFHNRLKWFMVADDMRVSPECVLMKFGQRDILSLTFLSQYEHIDILTASVLCFHALSVFLLALLQYQALSCLHPIVLPVTSLGRSMIVGPYCCIGN